MLPITWIFLAISIASCRPESYETVSKRQAFHPPPLVYPFGGTIKLVVGWAMPVELPGRTLVYAANFQFQYPLPQNATVFTEFFNDARSHRRRRAIRQDKSMLYEILEREFRSDEKSGPDCLKKSICEAGALPLKDEGLVGELLHVLLTPDHGGVLSVDRDYQKARLAGRRSSADCAKLYPFCANGAGVLDRILPRAPSPR